jgi:hypothetical protein
VPRIRPSVVIVGQHREHLAGRQVVAIEQPAQRAAAQQLHHDVVPRDEPTSTMRTMLGCSSRFAVSHTADVPPFAGSRSRAALPGLLRCGPSATRITGSASRRAHEHASLRCEHPRLGSRGQHCAACIALVCGDARSMDTDRPEHFHASGWWVSRAQRASVIEQSARTQTLVMRVALAGTIHS